jgi:hypothetical protein
MTVPARLRCGVRQSSGAFPFDLPVPKKSPPALANRKGSATVSVVVFGVPPNAFSVAKLRMHGNSIQFKPSPPGYMEKMAKHDPVKTINHSLKTTYEIENSKTTTQNC